MTTRKIWFGRSLRPLPALRLIAAFATSRAAPGTSPLGGAEVPPSTRGTAHGNRGGRS